MKVNSEKINLLINQCYANCTKLSELGQLSILFKAEFITGLATLISEANEFKNNAMSSIEFDFCWIDKIPLADIKEKKPIDHNGNLITKKVELGDMVIMFIDEWIDDSGDITSSEAISLIFQAKRAPSNKLPLVPVGTGKAINNSTAKEFYFLSKWPLFDLYKASGSKDPLHENIKISLNTIASEYGWYCACPTTNNYSWPCRWMCSPAVMGQSCDITMGEVIASLLDDGKIRSYKIGSNFNYDKEWRKIPNLDAWSTINNEIIEICLSLQLPSIAMPNINKTRVINKKVPTNLIQQLKKMSIDSEVLDLIIKRSFKGVYLNKKELYRVFEFLKRSGVNRRMREMLIGKIFDRDKDIFSLLAHYSAADIINYRGVEPFDDSKKLCVIKIHRRSTEWQGGEYD